MTGRLQVAGSAAIRPSYPLTEQAGRWRSTERRSPALLHCQTGPNHSGESLLIFTRPSATIRSVLCWSCTGAVPRSAMQWHAPNHFASEQAPESAQERHSLASALLENIEQNTTSQPKSSLLLKVNTGQHNTPTFTQVHLLFSSSLFFHDQWLGTK